MSAPLTNVFVEDFNHEEQSFLCWPVEGTEPCNYTLHITESRLGVVYYRDGHDHWEVRKSDAYLIEDPAERYIETSRPFYDWIADKANHAHVCQVLTSIVQEGGIHVELRPLAMPTREENAVSRVRVFEQCAGFFLTVSEPLTAA